MHVLLLLACLQPDDPKDPVEHDETGLDDTADSVEDYDCSERSVLRETLEVHSVEDAAAFCEQYNAIEGDLYATVPLPCLCDVQGVVYAREETRLPALVSVRNALNILDSDATDLTGFWSLETVGTVLVVSDCGNLVSLDGLQNLSSVGQIEVMSNASLQSLEGLSPLAMVGAELTVGYNASLESLEGLEEVTQARGLLFWGNSALRSIRALSNLETVDDFMLTGSPKLESLDGLQSLKSTQWLQLGQNALLTDLTALDHPISIRWLLLHDNRKLTSLVGLGQVSDLNMVRLEGNALTSMAPLGGWTTFEDIYLAESSLSDLSPLSLLTTVQTLSLDDVSPELLEDLAALRRVENTLTLTGKMSSLTPLGSLKVARHLVIEDTPLTTLDGLQNVRNMRSISVTDNDDLLDVMALATVKTVYGDVRIGNNPSLGDENAWALVDAIGTENIAGAITIYDN